MGEVEEAEFRGELRAHMRNTSDGIVEIKDDVRRQVDATDTLRTEMTTGFGDVGTRVALVEQAQSAHEEGHPNGGSSRGKNAALFGGGGITVAALVEAFGRLFKSGSS